MTLFLGFKFGSLVHILPHECSRHIIMVCTY